jgi:hypothetical protein
MKSKRYLILLLVVAVGLCLASCGAGKKTAATTAIKAAEDAYNTVKADLVKYVPEETKNVEDAISRAKESLNNKKFDEAIEAVKTIPDKIKELTETAATKKDELTKSWTEMSAEMPKTLETIKSKLDALSAHKKLPAGMDKAKLEGAKTGYDEAVKTWDEAQAAFTGGDVSDAVAKAKTVQDKAVEVMTTLGMKIPAPPAEN